MESTDNGRAGEGPAKESGSSANGAAGGDGTRRVSHVDHRTPGAGAGTGQEAEEAGRNMPGALKKPAAPPESHPLVQEMFRKTELHETPPTDDLRNQVFRKNSLKHLASQVRSIQERLDSIEFRIARAVDRLSSRIEDLEERGRVP
jgi:hypothetical protein